VGVPDGGRISARIIAAVGDGPTSWDKVPDQLGVDQLDTDACAVRGFLLEDGELAWVDQHGRPTAAAGQSTPVFGRELVRSTPTETAVQRARRERRERTAA
jgi:hypothetical protein